MAGRIPETSYSEHAGEFPITRRSFLTQFGALGIAATGLEAFVFEPKKLEVTQHGLGAVNGEGPSVGFVQLSDLHLRAVAAHEHRIAEAVHRLTPDFILFTGDVIDHRDGLHLLDTFLGLLDCRTPKYAIMGNWERWAGIAVDELAGIYSGHNGHLLINETDTLSHFGKRILITGLDDMIGGTPDLHSALHGLAPEDNHVLLAHCPAYRDTLPTIKLSEPEHRFLYMLSGHTHGGQLNLLGLAPFRPLGSGSYVGGWYRDREPHLYVSRGIGTSVVPARLGSIPEIPNFRWTLK
jgi:predicted MPP superfamily phosphohydrolase